MTRQEVDSLMCRPLWVDMVSPDGYRYVSVPAGASLDVGPVRYSYTGDGRCAWGDFAWFAREVRFKDGVVTSVFTNVYHD